MAEQGNDIPRLCWGMLKLFGAIVLSIVLILEAIISALTGRKERR